MNLVGKHGLRVGVAVAAMASAISMAPAAQAGLTLTAAGTSDGFTLSSFYQDPSVTYGMLGMTSMANGQIIGAGYGHATLNTFADVDGQTFGSALNGVGSPGTPTSVATAGVNTYLSVLGGSFYKVDPTTLGLTPLLLDTPAAAGYGLWANPATNHLESSSNIGLIDIDPGTGHVHFITGGFWDGVSVSPDGKTVYAAGSGGIFGFDIASGNQVFSVSAPGADGTGVISGTQFDGYIIDNNNNGYVGLINPATGIESIIADGGSRGDLVGPDHSNGTLFLTFYEQEYRLGISGGVIGGSAPEPATWALMLMGFGAMGAMLRRRTVRPSVA